MDNQQERLLFFFQENPQRLHAQGIVHQFKMVKQSQTEISIHRPKHLYPQSSGQWGAYLSGLIDGDGFFSKEGYQPKISICFHQKDVSLAYQVKRFVGHGRVSKVPAKKAYNYVLTSRLGILKLCLILTQLQVPHKVKRWESLCRYFDLKVQKPSGNSSFLSSHWLAGFIDAGGHLAISIRYRENRPNPTVRLTIQIDQHQKNKFILFHLKEQIGGTLYRNFRRKSITYSSSSLDNAEKWIHYLDRFPLCSNKYKENVIWRRAFFFVEILKKFRNFRTD